MLVRTARVPEARLREKRVLAVLHAQFHVSHDGAGESVHLDVVGFRVAALRDVSQHSVSKGSLSASQLLLLDKDGVRL